MILRIGIFSSKKELKHSFIWKEGEETGTCVQHANMWIHPAMTFAMFMDVVRHGITLRNDVLAVFYWDSQQGHWYDFE